MYVLNHFGTPFAIRIEVTGQKVIKVSKVYNTNILKVLRLTRDMMVLADYGDSHRCDKSCGILYGTLRDTAYKLRSMAEKERQLHEEDGLWDVTESP